MSTQRRLARRISLVGLVIAIVSGGGGCTTIESIFLPPPAPKVPAPLPPPPLQPQKEPAPPPPVKVEPEPVQPEKVEPEAPPAKKESPPPPTKAPAPAPAVPPVKKEPAPPPPLKKEPEPAPPVKKEPEAPPAKKETEAPPPVLAPQVGKEGEEQLRRTANSRIQRTEQLIGQLESKKLTGEQQEQFLTVQSLLGNAREALVTQDLAKAANLADKARILAEELAQSVK